MIASRTALVITFFADRKPSKWGDNPPNLAEEAIRRGDDYVKA